VGSAAHNTIIFTLGTLVPRAITPADFDGAYGYTVDFQVLGTSTTLNNDLTILFT
jgi:hypothetical protein